MIATAGEARSPHESTNKASASMAITQYTSVQHEHKVEEDDEDLSASEQSMNDDDEDQSSQDFQQLTLESADKETSEITPPTAGAATTDATVVVPVKRIRRNRKRMSEDERRIRHREVQRQFMKRKRARLGEMRKTIRGLEAQHRLVQVLNQREELEQLHAEFQERLAAPGSGWQWDDVPHVQQESKPACPPIGYMDHPMSESGIVDFQHHHSPTPIHYMPGLPPSLADIHHDPHHIQQYPAMYAAPHATSHRADAQGVPLPWDDILDAVTTSESTHFSF